MIWHIFKKDWKLLRWLVIGVVVVNAMFRLNRSTMGLFDSYSPLSKNSYLFSEISLLLTGALIVMLAQQDALPGLRQDWLVRPVRRRDLLLSKLAFVVLLIQLPIFLMEFVEGLAAGFPIGQSLWVPASRSLWMLIAMDLPLLAFATLTRNLTEAVGAAVAVVLGVAAFGTASLRPDLIGWFQQRTAFTWVAESAQIAWGLVAAIGILLLQYFWRKTVPARWISGSAIAIWLLLQLLPWQVAFAIGERLSLQPTASDSVQVAFDATREMFRNPRLNRDDFRPEDLRPGSGRRSGYVLISVPLRVSGTGEGKMLLDEQVFAHFTGQDGTVTDAFELPLGVEALHRGQMLWVRQDIYNKWGNQPGRLQLDYSLSLLKADPAQPVPATDGDRRIPGIGHCATRTHEVEGLVELGCVTLGNPPCMTFFLADQHTGKHNWEPDTCFPNYAPWFGRVEGDSMTRFGRQLHYVDFPGDMPQHPVNQAEIQDADIMIRVYRPQAHFTRQVLIPEFKMSDWAQ